MSRQTRHDAALTVLVAVSGIGWRDLPTDTAAAGAVVAIGTGLGVEDSLGQGQPTGPISGRVWELFLGRQHGRHAPESLVVVTQRESDVGGLEVVVGARLPLNGLHDEVVVSGVVGQIPVIDQCPPHGTAFPPVVITSRRWSGENTWRLARFVSVVVLQHIPRDSACCFLDVGWRGGEKKED